MEEKLKDAVRPQTTNQRILHDLRAIQAEIELIRVHCIELENRILYQMTVEENRHK